MYEIIIVEDDPMVAAVNNQYLQTIPQLHLAGSFRNGEEAFAYAKDHPVDLAIVDYYMPVLSGDEFIRKCHDAHLRLDFIMITAANGSREIQDMLRLGAIDYLVKPFTRQRFLQAMRKFLELREAMQTGRRLEQNEIDKLMLIQHSSSGDSQEFLLDKGLQHRTLVRIQKYLGQNPDCYLSCEEISRAVSLSRITVRRYMNYLLEIQEITSQVDYTTGGRPCIKYRKNSPG